MSKVRTTTLRIPRASGTAAKQRNLAGGLVIGDWLDKKTDERVLVIQVESKSADKPEGVA